jgi:hypothetical protein
LSIPSNNIKKYTPNLTQNNSIGKVIVISLILIIYSGKMIIAVANHYEKNLPHGAKLGAWQAERFEEMTLDYLRFL